MCSQGFHHAAETACPHCGYSLAKADAKYGKADIHYRRVYDRTGALRQRERVKLNLLLEKLEKRLKPSLLSVYFPDETDSHSLTNQCFWTMNHVKVDAAGFPNHDENTLDPKWLLILVIDIRSGSAFFMWGYELDPYVEPDLINKSITRQRIPLREGLFMRAAYSIMKDATRLIARKGRSLIKHPFQHGLIAPEPKKKGDNQ